MGKTGVMVVESVERKLNMRHLKQVLARFFGINGLVLCCMLLAQPVLAEVAVIVNPANASDINEKMIKKIFLGKQKKFPNGQVVIPLNSQEGTPSRDSFNKTIIGRSATQISSHWARLVFTGKGTQPQDLASDAEIIKTVSSNQGAISYVDAASVTANVKVIAKF
jgi:ABC-type phosphate transport system substrate-binding protein